MRRILLAITTITFAACSSQSSVEATQDTLTHVMDTQRSAVKDSVTFKADSNKKRIDSSIKVLKDSVRKER